eukprot:2600144-Pleurochrysis_carterae.AAC.1
MSSSVAGMSSSVGADGGNDGGRKGGGVEGGIEGGVYEKGSSSITLMGSTCDAMHSHFEEQLRACRLPRCSALLLVALGLLALRPARLARL